MQHEDAKNKNVHKEKSESRGINVLRKKIAKKCKRVSDTREAGSGNGCVVCADKSWKLKDGAVFLHY